MSLIYINIIYSIGEFNKSADQVLPAIALVRCKNAFTTSLCFSAGMLFKASIKNRSLAGNISNKSSLVSFLEGVCCSLQSKAYLVTNCKYEEILLATSIIAL